MKWIFIAGLIVFTPLAAAFLRANQRYIIQACFLLGFAIFFQDAFHLSVSPISWGWMGTVKGIQVSFVDSLAIAMMFSTPSIRIPLALKLGLSIYVLGILVSSLSVHELMPVAFYVWQFGRAVLVFLAIARVSARHENAPLALAAGLGCAIIIESLLVVKQFAGGNRIPGGTLGHRNILGMTSHFATMPAIALLLAGYRKRLAALTLFCGAVAVLLGGSRATLGLLILGMLVTILLSMRHKMTGRKRAVAAASAALAICAAPLILWSVNQRSATELQSSDIERGAMIDAARMIIADYPLGVGANQYVVVANVGGYSARAGVPWNYSDRSAPVHNSYFLVTAELGMIGLIGLLSMFAVVLATGWSALRSASGVRSELLVGFLSAVLILAMHIAFEWVFELASVQYLTACAFGVVVGITASLEASERRQRVQQTPGALRPALPGQA